MYIYSVCVYSVTISTQLLEIDLIMCDLMKIMLTVLVHDCSVVYTLCNHVLCVCVCV